MQLKREIGLFGATALGIGAIIGSGIFIVTGIATLAHSGSPLADAIAVTGSPVAVLLISAGAMVATASVLLTTIMGISRIVFSMARSQDLPMMFGAIHPRFSTPHSAIVIT